MSWWYVIWGVVTVAASKLSDYIEAVFCMLKVFWCWVLTSTLEIALDWLEPLLTSIGGPPDAINFGFLAGTWATLDYYTPATEAVAFIAAYGAIYLAIITYRLIKTHIPTLS
jgi:hypothetical protein